MILDDSLMAKNEGLFYINLTDLSAVVTRSYGETTEGSFTYVIIMNTYETV